VSPSKRRTKDNAAEGSGAESDISLFHQAVSGATPLRQTPRIPRRSEAPRSPIKVAAEPDRNNTYSDSILGSLSLNPSTELAEVLTYRRLGMRLDTIRKLRRGHWMVQDTLDLHGANREEARRLLAGFITSCREQGIRSVKIIHGKGLRSPNQEPVIRSLLRGWLVGLEDVLAYCEAPPNDGGSGATLVLLAAK